jgi:hypothetical protein
VGLFIQLIRLDIEFMSISAILSDKLNNKPKLHTYRLPSHVLQSIFIVKYLVYEIFHKILEVLFVVCAPVLHFRMVKRVTIRCSLLSVLIFEKRDNLSDKTPIKQF